MLLAAGGFVAATVGLVAVLRVAGTTLVGVKVGVFVGSGVLVGTGLAVKLGEGTKVGTAVGVSVGIGDTEGACVGVATCVWAIAVWIALADGWAEQAPRTHRTTTDIPIVSATGVFMEILGGFPRLSDTLTFMFFVPWPAPN